MDDRKWRGLSPSMVLAWLAAFVALGGTSLASSRYAITSTKQIRPNVLRVLRGASGPQGLRGLTGSTGPKGSAGAAGAAGTAGVRGETGATGAAGANGTDGVAGATGPSGAKGEAGAKGSQGSAGAEGPHGVTGVTGPEGKEGKAGQTGATGPEGKEGAKGETGAAATTLWAVVAENGTLVRGGTGSVEALKLEAGLYEVFFNRDVSRCAYIVSLGKANGSPPGVHGGADATGGVTAEQAGTVYVETTNLKGEKAAEPFHLAVFC